MLKTLKILMLLGALSQLSCSRQLANWAVGVERWRSDLVEKRLAVGELEIAYLEGGQGPTVFLVHGFGGDKEHWTRFARQLTDHYHVVAMDLPGFGESTRDERLSYQPQEQAARLDRFREALKLDRIHIVGNSMGGMIAGIYAHDFPAHTLSLTLIDNAGIESPNPSELSRELAAGRNPLLVEKPEDFKRLLAFTFVNPPYIPGPVLNRIYERNAPYQALSRKIFAEIVEQHRVLESMLPAIKVPTLVLWGEQDRVLDVSSTQVIQKLKPDAEVKVLKECGHAPMIEKVDESSEMMLEFLGRRFARESVSVN